MLPARRAARAGSSMNAMESAAFEEDYVHHRYGDITCLPIIAGAIESDQRTLNSVSNSRKSAKGRTQVDS